MRILFLSDNFPPEVNAPASRTFEHCREWVRGGHEVTVVTCAPNFPQGRVHAGYRNRLVQREAMDGIEVVRVWSYIAPNEGFARRVPDYLSFAFGAFAAGLFRRFDIVIATSPQFFTTFAAFALSKLRRRPWIFELRDLWPQSIVAVGALRDGRALRLLERIEMALYRDADTIVAVTNAFRDDLVRRGIDGGKIAVVTNGADLSRFCPRPRDDALARSLGLEGRFVAGYVGTHGLAHALETLLDAAERLQANPGASNIRLLLLGDGAAKNGLIMRAQQRKLSNVLFLDSVPKEEVARYWSLLDGAIIHLKRDPVFRSVIPSKLFECMAMGVPVLHGVEGESAEIVACEEAGLLFEPENADALCTALLDLGADESLRRRFARNAVQAAARYDRAQLARQMLEILEETEGRAIDGAASGARAIASPRR